jgi:GNAT superfamily N-acetyltransferase
MFFREAKNKDITKIHAARISVAAHTSADFHLVGPDDYLPLLEGQGKGWVCEVDGDILGFALVDARQARVGALFVRPGQDSTFIGRMLHDMMTSWCFARGLPRLSLTTAPGTRAGQFYRKAGWVKTHQAPDGATTYALENNLEPRDF